jgi:hypothetical protein
MMKRATKALADAGYPHLEVRKGMYGYYCLDRRFKRQRGTLVRQSAGDVVRDVVEHGARPESLDDDARALALPAHDDEVAPEVLAEIERRAETDAVATELFRPKSG